MEDKVKEFSRIIIEEINKVKLDFYSNVVKKIGSDNTILFYCRFCEYIWYQNYYSKKSPMHNVSKITFTLSEIIRWVKSQKHVNDQAMDLEIDFGAYFELALKTVDSRSAFLSYSGGLFDVESVNSCEVKFKYKSSEIEKYESINFLLITDHKASKNEKYKKKIENGKKRRRLLNPNFISKAIIDTEFDLPNDYKMLSYNISELKEFWYQLYNYVKSIEKSNRKVLKGIKEIKYHTNEIKFVNAIQIPIFKKDQLKCNGIELQKCSDLIDMFSFNGNNKFNRIHSSLVTEPLIELSGKRYCTVPMFLYYYEIQRYTLQIFDKYIDYYEKNSTQTVIKDDFKREPLLIERMDKIFNVFTRKGRNIKIKETDIDYIVYDSLNKTLLCFELKWLTEPHTPIEIIGKDVNLVKALEDQLPKYKRAINEECENILKKAFGTDFNETPEKFYYFVVTDITIGSGLLDRSEFKVINCRMLQKALCDSEFNLYLAAQKLDSEFYIGSYNNFFENVNLKSNCFGIEVSQPESKYREGFSLN